MAKDNVYDDVLVRAHGAAQMVSHVSPISASRYLVNAYLEQLPQYLLDNPEQIDLPENAEARQALKTAHEAAEEAAKKAPALKKAREAEEAKAAKAKEDAAKEVVKEAAKPNHKWK
jgi:hypothetical protein